MPTTIAGFQSAFLGGAMIAAFGVLLTIVLLPSRDSRAQPILKGRATRERRSHAEA